MTSKTQNLVFHLKENMNKQLNELRENTNKLMSESKQTIERGNQ
jgi:hypothetical protein